MQDSWCWECTGIGDGDNRTVNDIINQNQLLGNLRPADSGVIYWTNTTALQGFTNASDGLLAPTNPAGDTVRIASGAALVQGWLYANDADVDFDVSGGAANATDLIVLRRDDPAAVSSVRLALVRGPAAGTATVTQTATTWEIALAEVLLDGAGNFSALTDVRELAYPPVGAMVRIGEFVGDGVVTQALFASIPPLFRHLHVVGQTKLNAAVGGAFLSVQFNGDGGANYDELLIAIDGNAAVAAAAANFATTGIKFGNTSGSTVPANYADSFTLDIPNYADAILYQSTISHSQNFISAALGNISVVRGSGWWQNVAAITQVRIFEPTGPTAFAVGTRITLYGLV